MRILTVASGKGGVGKTTFAVNFALALSRSAPTILVDLDTGTSSVRTALKTPIERDLYHFFKKGEPLERCVTRLGPELDPEGRMSGFGFVAGPRHYMEEIAQLPELLRRQLAAGIAALPAEYVVLDLKAGLDRAVIDLMPYTNSGLLVFTPHNPAATLAAADLVKALLFRSLRILTGPGSWLFRQGEIAAQAAKIGELLSRAEDAYDEEIGNVDAFLVALAELLGPHTAVELLAEAVAAFRVHCVLNMFNGIEESFEGAITPFLERLAESSSTRLRVGQLGWVVYDKRVEEANSHGVPILLERHEPPPPPPALDPLAVRLAEIEASVFGPRAARRPAQPARAAAVPEAPRIEEALGAQLESLKLLYGGKKNDRVRENFAYLAARALALSGPGHAPTELGQTSLAAPEQLLSWFEAHGKSRTAG